MQVTFSELEKIFEIVREAGDKLLELQKDELQIKIKADGSKVSNADYASNEIICEGLKGIFPEIAIVSEEFEHQENIKASKEKQFFLIDPLDGTHPYLRGEDEFAICLALIENNRPSLGVIYLPSTKEMFYNFENEAFVQNANLEIVKIKCRNKEKDLVALSSHRMENNQDFADYCAQYPIAARKQISSAVKFTIIARGDADLFPYFGNTMQWDVAAGDAIIDAAGGVVTKINGELLGYGFNSEDEDFKNPFFVAKTKSANATL
jgi:3'(2'), 5'-bisphosphate nucleotidase